MTTPKAGRKRKIARKPPARPAHKPPASPRRAVAKSVPKAGPDLTIDQLVAKAQASPGSLTVAQARQLRDLQRIRKAVAIPGDGPIPDERERQRRLMAKKRAIARDISIPEIVDLKRRHRCVRNIANGTWHRTYFPDIFYHPFTKDQLQMLRDILDRVRHGGKQAVAMPRSDGKSSIAKITVMACICEGWLRFPVVIGANATESGRSRKDIQVYFETNDLLAEDYPEVCYPIRELQGAPQRAAGQTFAGERTGLIWSGDFLRFAKIAGSKASWALFASKGIDGAIRGLNFQGLRPDFVLGDDLETRESVKSSKMTGDRIAILEGDVAELGGPDRSIAMLMLCTIMRKGCLADIYTDRRLKPAWSGTRVGQLVSMPTRTDLWDEYIQIRQRDQFGGDVTGRKATAFYRLHRREMDEGSKVSNPHRFIADKCPDGTRREISALQHCYNIIADSGWEHFKTEYQNEPPDVHAGETQLVSSDVQRKMNGLRRGLVPAWAETLTAYIDVGGRANHWVVVASRQGFASAVVDYDADPVHSPRIGRLTSEENIGQVDQAILSALLGWRDREREYGWPMADTGEVRHVDLCLVDSGWREDPVFEFVRSCPGGQYRPSKGRGSNQAEKYRAPTKRSKERTIGHHYFASWQEKARVWLYELDVDYWKRFVHDGLATSPDWDGTAKPGATPERGGSLTLYGDDPLKHHAFAEQILAEIWRRDWEEGKGWREYFDQISKHNHFLDATAGALAAASVKGIRAIVTASGGSVGRAGRQRPRVSVRNW